MRVTVKGQVTIPQHIREKLGITKNKEVDFVEDKGKIFLVVNNDSTYKKFKRLRGCATVKMTTNEILSMTRED